MKKLIFLSLLSICLGCSSTVKKPDSNPATQPDQTHPQKKAATSARKSTASSAMSTHCKSGADERTIEVLTKDEGCEVSYTKAGKATVVASGHSGTQHCLDTLKKMQGKLRDAGFSCE